ncbi:hypothetical protein V8E36_003983 [Tilletia maclaganii]
MRHIILLLSVAVLNSSITVPLRIANETDFFYPNGTLDAANVRHHIHYFQCHSQQSRRAKSLCRFDAPLHKHSASSIGLFSAYHAATPVGELRIGGQAFNVIFDTIVPVTIVDPRAYHPDESRTALRIEQPRLSLYPTIGERQVSRWRDVTSVGGIQTTTTFDRAEQHIFTSDQTVAMGICAMSRYHTSSGGAYSLIEVLARNSLINQPVFALSLSRLEQTTQTAPNGGTLSLGYHRRRLRFSPLEQDPRYAGLWAISGHLNNIPSTMILASGSPFIILPVRLARSIFGTLGLVVEEHDTTLFAKYVCTSPPDFYITFPAISVRLDRDSVRFDVDEAGLCISSIIGEVQRDIMLGLPFFRSAYVAFDLSGRVGQYGAHGRIGIGLPRTQQWLD